MNNARAALAGAGGGSLTTNVIYVLVSFVIVYAAYRLVYPQKDPREALVLEFNDGANAQTKTTDTDQDNLPEYDVIDGIIERYVEQNQSAAQIVAAGFERAAVEQIVRLIRINEYKRKQSPPGPRITSRAYGRDWRYPLSNGFRETF